MLDSVINETGTDPQWAVLWLHGLGADGNDFAPIVPELLRPHWPAIRFVFPHAPVQPITINNGVPMRAWYDIVSMDFRSRADAAGVAASVQALDTLIDQQVAAGIPAERILLAGFSQGGAVILSAVLRRSRPIGGLIALSTYLPDPETAADQRDPDGIRPPVFMAHGVQDPVIPQAIAAHTAQTLKDLGFPLEWHSYPMAHQVCAEELEALGDWLDARFRAA
ncbi:alpha/beta hydrolase [Stenotrophomonas rhizophila]|uniref:alpha/beta hydrolase n=1 Tax=Stenotrophomonas rhizophila TaxID=216778 RepID=UPI0028D03655|nr:carboxylesterase [Stenotrophomonas rhizophila]